MKKLTILLDVDSDVDEDEIANTVNALDKLNNRCVVCILLREFIGGVFLLFYFLAQLWKAT